MSNLYVFLLTFFTIFLAELGDKTQLAVLSLSAQTRLPFIVFLGASSALSLLSFIGAYLGSFLFKILPKSVIEKITGLILIIVGFLFLLRKN